MKRSVTVHGRACLATAHKPPVPRFRRSSAESSRTNTGPKQIFDEEKKAVFQSHQLNARRRCSSISVPNPPSRPSCPVHGNTRPTTVHDYRKESTTTTVPSIRKSSILLNYNTDGRLVHQYHHHHIPPKPAKSSSSNVSEPKSPKSNGEYAQQLAKEKDHIKQVSDWESRVRLELEIERELMEKEYNKKLSSLESECAKLEEKERLVRRELTSREIRLNNREQELKGEMERWRQRMITVDKREAQIESIVEQKVKVRLEAETSRLKEKFIELDYLREEFTVKERAIGAEEVRLRKLERTQELAWEERRRSTIELDELSHKIGELSLENETLKRSISARSDYELVKEQCRSSKSEMDSLKKQFRDISSELREEKRLSYDEKTKQEEEISSLNKTIASLRKKTKEVKWQDAEVENELRRKCERLQLELAQARHNMKKIIAKNQLLAKEIISSHSVLSQLQKPLSISTEQISKRVAPNGCQDCEDKYTDSLVMSTKLINDASVVLDEISQSGNLLEFRNRQTNKAEQSATEEGEDKTNGSNCIPVLPSTTTKSQETPQSNHSSKILEKEEKREYPRMSTTRPQQKSFIPVREKSNNNSEASVSVNPSSHRGTSGKNVEGPLEDLFDW